MIEHEQAEDERQPRLLNISDVATRRGVAQKTVYRWLERYPKGAEFEFPQPDFWMGVDTERPQPGWRVEREADLLEWTGPGQGAGGGGRTSGSYLGGNRLENS